MNLDAVKSIWNDHWVVIILSLFAISLILLFDRGFKKYIQIPYENKIEEHYDKEIDELIKGFAKRNAIVSFPLEKWLNTKAVIDSENIRIQTYLGAISATLVALIFSFGLISSLTQNAISILIQFFTYQEPERSVL